MHPYRIRKIIVLEIAHPRIFRSAVTLQTLRCSVSPFILRVIIWLWEK